MGKKIKTHAKTPKTNPQLYDVEKIVDKRISDSGCLQYKIRWEGYAQKDDTWEPIQMLENCLEILKEYQKEKEAQKKKDKRKESAFPSKISIPNLMDGSPKEKIPNQIVKKNRVLRSHLKLTQSIGMAENEKRETPQLQEGQKIQRSSCKNYYNISKIVDKRINIKNKVQYKVRWLGFSQEEDTWQPIQNLEKSQKLYQKFDQKLQKKKAISKDEKFMKFTVRIKKNEKLYNSFYEIQNIIDKRILHDGTCEYRVRWKDYSQDSDTWQPLKNLRKVINLVDSFNKKYIEEHNQIIKETKFEETLQKQQEIWKQSHIIFENLQEVEKIQQYQQQQYSQSVKQISIFNDPIIQMQIENDLLYF